MCVEKCTDYEPRLDPQVAQLVELARENGSLKEAIYSFTNQRQELEEKLIKTQRNLDEKSYELQNLNQKYISIKFDLAKVETKLAKLTKKIKPTNILVKKVK